MELNNQKKGAVFTYDALIAASLLLVSISLVMYTAHENSQTPKLTSIDKYKIATDLINILQIYTLKDLKEANNTLYNNIITNLNITNEEENIKISEIIALAHISGRDDIAANIIKFLLPLNENFAVYANNTEIYKVGSDNANMLVSSAILPISGYAENKNPLGYSARAYAKKIERNTTLIYPIYVGGSGNEGAPYTQTKLFYVDVNQTDIINASIYFAVHYGGDETIHIQSLKLNDVNIKSRLVWLWEDNGFNVGAYGYIDVHDIIKSGWNNFTITFTNPYFHSHTHPGGRIEIITKKRTFYKPMSYKNKTFYFDDAFSKEITWGWWWRSYTGAWEVFDFYVPEGSLVNNATLYLNIKDVEDSGGWAYDNGWIYINEDVIVRINGQEIYAKDGLSGDLELSFNILPYLKEGTNYIIVYANCYGNYFFGIDETRIYSDPKNDPLHSSRVFLNYTLDRDSRFYGYIDVTKSYEFGGAADNPYNTIITLNTSATVQEALLHLAQKYSYDIEVWFNNHSGYSDILIYESQGARDVPSSIYMKGYLWNTKGDNEFNLIDTCNGCEFLPWSSAEVKLLIPSFVSYGKIFENEEDAINDAINRLQNLIGSEINILEISNETLSTGNIPWMYGPLLLKVKVWV